MSTLNSSQLYVKRSSTRLHAPPGGHSSLSFGSGGFGTTDPVDKSGYIEPAELPSTAGSFLGGGMGYGAYNHPANNQVSDGGYGNQAPLAFHAIKGGSSYQPQVGHPPASSYGYGGGSSAQPVPLPSTAGSTGSYATSAHGGCPAFSQSNFSWGGHGAQQPLTSSKRDQNWEKKRRLWLARKNGGSQCLTPSTFGSPSYHQQLPPPPATAFQTGGAGGYYDLSTQNPPSPLTKFMAQQNHSKLSSPQEGTGRCDAPPASMYDAATKRPPSSLGALEYPPRLATTAGYREEQFSPPATAHSSAANGYGARQLVASTGFPNGLGFSSNAHPPPTSGAMYSQQTYSATPGTAASRRQPPGGNTNWNPYG